MSKKLLACSSMKNILMITEEQARQAVSMKMALPIFKRAYEACERGEMYAGGRIVIPIRGEENCGQWLVANCTKVPIFGAKFSSVFPGNIPKGIPSIFSQISLYSAETGELIALIEANYLTAVKTGGSAAIATELMARKDACRLGVIGSGVQAFTQVLAIQEVRQLSELRVYDRFPERIEAFVAKIKGVRNNPYKIIKCTSADECVNASDMISTCTTSLTPVFDAAALRPGTHLNAIGSFTPFMQEVDEGTVMRASRVVTEHVGGLWEAAGDILIPFNKGLITKDKVAGSVGEMLVGKIPSRESDAEITMYESVGSCVLDVAIAIAAYDAFKNNSEE
ncbi:MAG: ornithine cyclodeaminase family protein [bacterium]|nr:ornithine cyclodeaminase family protein [bacterium]